LVVYHFVKKALNGNGSVSVSEEETANAIGLKGLRRPRSLKIGGLPGNQVCCKYEDGTAGISTSGCTENYYGSPGRRVGVSACAKAKR
jgi:hypothetical protein